MKTTLAIIASFIIGLLGSASEIIVSVPKFFSKKSEQIAVSPVMKIGEQTITLEIADTAQKQMRGLSGRESLAENSGMLFVFNNSRIRTFWMKGMRFPIDIVWIREDGTVADCAKNIPPPPDPSQLVGLETRSSQEPVKYVLELNTGKCQEWNIRPGAILNFETN